MNSSMKLLALALVAMGLATMGIAEPPPPVPDGGLTHYRTGYDCTDPMTGLVGNCFYSYDNRQNHYMAFYTEGGLCMYIEQRIDGMYKEIWRRGADA